MSKIDNFEILESECMKVLTSKPGYYFSQYDIYNHIIEKFEIKNPSDRDRFKYRILIVLRGLSNVFPDVTITNKDNILYLCFTLSEKNDNEIIQNNTNNEEIKKIEMPTEISVIQFILDQNLNEFINQKDYLGNNLLHYLIINSDIERLSKNYIKLKHMISENNNDNKNPLDLIKDFKTSNFFLTLLYNTCKNNNVEINSINVKYNKLEEKLKNQENKLFFSNLSVFVLIIFLIVVYMNNN
jgi:hypothetical protein